MESDLPNELLAQIFKAGTTLSSPCPGCLPCLISYSAVSKRWRSSCLEYPDLWTNINVPFSMRNVEAWIALSLERSKSCLFDITLQLPDINNLPAYMSVVTNVMLLVVQHVHRLRRLAIQSEFFLSNPEKIFALLQNAQRAPRLTVLHLTFSDLHPIGSVTIPQGSLLMQAPSLSSLRLHGVVSPVPFVGLRSLDIQGLRTTYSAFSDFCRLSPLLTDLILPKLRLMLDLKSKPLPPIEIPSLKTLALSFCKPPPSNSFNPCHSLLSLLSTPNLEYLELAGGNMPDLAKCFPDPSAFTRLRTLRLVNVSIFARASRTEPEVDNCAYLRALTTVEELELIHSHAKYLLPTENDKDKILNRRPRTRSINFRDSEIGLRTFYPLPQRVDNLIPRGGLSPVNGQQDLPDPVPIYPNLRSISLDALPAAEVLWLYQFVLERPQIEVVRLSPVVERHFASSLGTVDGVLHSIPNTSMKKLGASEHDPVDVGKLLRERVLVKKIETDGYIQWQGAVI
ncbi:hypothetical protein DFH07DRAFT_53555 [Mycena maculata]|uniref:F-box domain-containing protein n=1 Tax=Mycena maculata TaxID=230809 RepID=A0AAD7N1C7_9AGAR|nr:hypothetical protein DFH07DRAFT_53555 [Mycena maculata]